MKKAEEEFYAETEETRSFIKNKIDLLSIEKAPLTITVSGKAGSPLKVRIETPDSSFVLFSETDLVSEGTSPLDLKTIMGKFKTINESEYFIEQIELNNLQPDLYIPFKELASLKNRILYILKDSKETYPPIELPGLKRQKNVEVKTTISVLISSQKDLNLCHREPGRYLFPGSGWLK